MDHQRRGLRAPNAMTIDRKIILLAAGTIALTTATALAVQRMVIRSQGIELTRNTMRAAVLAAENVRATMSSLRQRNAFDDLALHRQLGQATDFRQTALYDSVPVVAAWKSIRKVALQEGFDFRTPKRHARNPQNEPDPGEAAILDRLERTAEEEYFEVNRAADTIVYARPIRLTADCLSCHGDPSNSPTHDGKDALGFQMEGWKEGELHGAFLLKARLDEVNHVASARAVSRAGQTTLLWMLPVALLIAFGSLWFSRGAIIRPLHQIIQTIEASSSETSAASGQISAASQNLAGSATEQAATLEGIHASMRSIAEETRHAAEGAHEVKNLASSTHEAAIDATADMKRMQQSMDEIDTASHAVAKIIKSIDEIAFQTNVLALNAAVEAARAGEAGAGFAVVADEVRSLAQRSAAAARETTALVGDSLERSQRGVAICNEVMTRLDEIENRGKPLHDASASIANAAEQQRASIENITGAVNEMNSVTQGIAAHAEQSAASSVELSGQAEALLSAIADLSRLVGAHTSR